MTLFGLRTTERALIHPKTGWKNQKIHIYNQKLQLVTNLSSVITENDPNSSMDVKYCPKTPKNGKKVHKKDKTTPKISNF